MRAVWEEHGACEKIGLCRLKDKGFVPQILKSLVCLVCHGVFGFKSLVTVLRASQRSPRKGRKKNVVGVLVAEALVGKHPRECVR